MMKRPFEIILKDDVQEVLDSFALCFGIRILFYSPDMEIVRFGDNRLSDSRYCQLVMDRLYGAHRCQSLDEEQLKEAAKSRAMVSYTCHAGLLEAIMPVYAEDNLLGYVMMGQVRTQRALPAHVADAWPDNREKNNLRAAFEDLPFVPPGQVNHILRLFSMLVNYIVSQNMVELRGNFIVAGVVKYIESHLGEPIRLTDAAASVYRSESTVSHLVKGTLGKTFKQLVIDKKLDKADEFMRTVPGITVADVAARVGYSDPFHFSNLYRKHRKCPPSEVLRRYKT